MERIETDLLILGAGGAGLCAALHAADRAPGLGITLVVKGLLGRAGCTRMVQGGYNAALRAPDSLEAHFLDTLKGGGFLNDQELAWRLVETAPARVAELETRYGCFFDRGPDGRIHQKPFAGQSHDRTIHKGDLTGIEIMNRLTEQIWARPQIRVAEEHRALDLLQDGEGRVGGALLLDIRTGAFVTVSARATLLAMGGGPTMYRVIACSADKSADGIALAYRAGAPLRDMEMVQFHPTGLVVPGSLMTGALLEEGLRGAGGRLFNASGERFMARYDPVRLERSTRDVVARASYLEIGEGRGTPEGGVWLDVSHLGAEFVERHFRGMVRRCRDFALDLARRPVPVMPTAHFLMGGVVIDPDCRTALEGLFAAGEDAGGVHGANRLGGNGVADSTVFGGIAGEVMASFVVGRPRPALSERDAEHRAAAARATLGTGARDDTVPIRAALRDVMWEEAGLVRTEAGLSTALQALEDLAGRLEAATVPGGPAYNLAWQGWLDARNQALAARLIARSALARRESRGAHYRADYPEPDDARWLVNVLVAERCGELGVWTEPVRLTRARPDAAAPAAMVEIGD
ncbi:MAG: FAD-binding protein [Candidatus Rokubacteria bacterium]|nr:FAD-binding protein [Candidatus Rokubacteria bacterium]